MTIRDYYGISSHTNYRSSAQYGNDAQTLDLTMKAKPYWMRDLLSIANTYDQDALWRKYAAAGIKGVHATVGVFAETPDSDRPKMQARLVKSAGLLAEVTGWNEPDGKTTIGGWLGPTIAHQKWLWQTVKNNPATAHIKVGLGALRGANWNGSVETGKLVTGAAGYFDFVDLHCYPGPNRDVAQNLDEHIAWAHGKPVMLSEFGGSTANMSLADQARVVTTGVKYLASKRIKCFVYELWDDPDSTGQNLQSNFGIYESTGADKPVVAALRTLVA